MPQTVTQYDEVILTWAVSGPSAAVTITAPDESTLTPAASSGSTPGQFTTWFMASQVGDYQVSWVMGGETFEDTVTVTAFQPVQLLSIQDCYLSLNIPSDRAGSNPTVDADMLEYAESATNVVEGIVGPQRKKLVREVHDGGVPAILLDWAPTTIVSVSENGVEISDFVLDLVGGVIHAGTTYFGRPFWPGTNNVIVQYLAGEGRVSSGVMLAIREEFRFLWQQGRQGSLAPFGDQYDASPATPQGFAIPNRVYELLAAEPGMPGFA